MKFLLDTHTLLWSILSVKFLSSTASKLIGDEDHIMLVSAASAWEVATKVRLGKLPDAEVLEMQFAKAIQLAGYSVISIEMCHALRAGRFTADHKDPFDRIIAAQAISLDIPVISSDAKLDAFGVRRIW